MNDDDSCVMSKNLTICWHSTMIILNRPVKVVSKDDPGQD